MKKSCAFIALLLCASMQSADGDLDTSFGSSGIVGTPGTAEGRALLLQPDGSIVVAGNSGADLQVARYRSNGSLDSSFGANGIVTTVEAAVGRAVLLQPDGKIVAVGNDSSDFVLGRYHADGSVDTSFGMNGVVITDFGGTDEAQGALLQPDGRIVVVGRSDAVFALARYNADGSLDPSFGTNGTVTTDFGGAVDRAYAVLLQPDGKIIAVGLGGSGNDFALARYNIDGSLDTSFGTNGTVTTNLDDADVALAAVLQLDGKIIAAGTTAGQTLFALIRYNSDGSLDKTFNGTGIVTTNFGGSVTGAYAVLLQPDGKAIALGIGKDDFALARYNADGSPDLSFGNDGLVTTAINGGSDHIYSAAVQADGKIVVAGNGGTGFTLARYLIDSINVSPFARDLRAKFDLIQKTSG